MSQEEKPIHTYPSHFPEGCPETENTEHSKREAFRIIRQEAPTEQDFLSYKELGKRDCCRSCGISVFESLEAAKHRLKISPSIGRNIAKGHIGGDTGAYRLTSKQTGHICWWPYEQTSRISCFPEVA